jgi:hypothetical protein
MGRPVHWFPCGIRPLTNAARIVAAGLLGSAITACTGWPGPYESAAHLKDDPFDRAVMSSDWSKVAAIARQRLVARYPIGSSVVEARRYLESIGAICERGLDGSIVCRYSQYGFLGNRGVFGDEWQSYLYFDFTTKIQPSDGPITKLAVCSAQPKEVERGPMLLSDRHNRSRQSKFKPCGGPSVPAAGGGRRAKCALNALVADQSAEAPQRSSRPRCSVRR